MAKTRVVKVTWRTHAKAERVRLYAELKERQRACEQLEGEAARLQGRLGKTQIQLDKVQLLHRSSRDAVVEIGGKLELIDWLEMKEEGH